MEQTETTPLLISETKQTQKVSCWRVIREEFRLKNFCFDYERADAFYKSQWRCPRLVFVLFRLALAIYTGTICILTLVYFPRQHPQWPWPSWLSNWSYMLLTLHEICSATIAVVHSMNRTRGFCCKELDDAGRDDISPRGFADDVTRKRRTDDSGSLPFHLKLDWLLFSVAAPVAIMITLGFLIYEFETLGPVSVKSLNNHFLNGMVVLIEMCVVAVPVRLLHVVYIVLYYSLYYLFSYIVWSFDHTANVLYSNMDWENPGSVMSGWAVTALILPLLIQIVLFTLYRLRIYIYTKIYGHEERGYETISDY